MNDEQKAKNMKENQANSFLMDLWLKNSSEETQNLLIKLKAREYQKKLALKVKILTQ